MKQYISVSFTFFLVLVLFMISPQVVDAHSTTCVSGSEVLGYVVNCNTGHAGTKTITYRFDNVPTKYQGFTTTGASRWNNTGVVTISSSLSLLVKNLVQTYEDNDVSTVAYVSKTYNTTTKHIINWTMRYNKKAMEPRSPAKNNGTSTHEFGHTIGLADLKNSGNINKLMYGYSNRTAVSPTSSDITGAKEAVK